MGKDAVTIALMDPICHTLVGAALGHTGLEKKTRFARSTLVIAANLPDIDVVAHAMGETASYAFRRGITHGAPALIVLPILLAGAMWMLGRLRPNRAASPPLSFRGLLLLSYIGVVSHPLLDWMNTYGMRWLMPMVDRWFYGDTLFIIDWVAWAILAVGLLASWRVLQQPQPWYRRPASVALLVLTAYIAANWGITQNARRTTLTALAPNPPLRLLASPVPFNPLRREIVLEYDDEYRFGHYDVASGEGFVTASRVVSKGSAADLDRARLTVDGRRFLHWARFPYSVRTIEDGKTRLTIADARYIWDVENPRLDGFAVLHLDPSMAPAATD